MIESSFREFQDISTIADSIQGVCTDGTYYYVSDNTTLYKYDSSGTKVAEEDCSSYGTVHHLGDLCIVSGVLYVVADNYPSTSPSKLGYIQEYNASDLSYRNTEYLVNNTAWTSGVAHDGTVFWTVDNDSVIRRWTGMFSSSSTVSTDFTPTGTHGWQGIVWDGDYLYANPHDGSTPHNVQKFFYNGTDLEICDFILRPTYCTQGLDIDGSTMVLASRHTGFTESIKLTTLYEDMARGKIVWTKADATQRSTTSNGYVEQGNLKINMNVKQGEIIEVVLQGLFKNSAGSLRAYVDAAGGSAVTVTHPSNVRSMRTGATGSEGESLGMLRHVVADSDGLLTLVMHWRQNTAGQTAYAWDRTMSARIVGLANEQT